jgi:6-phosphogluconolactonase
MTSPPPTNAALAETRSLRVLVGTYTQPLDHVQGRAAGIYEHRLDASTGRLGPARLVASAPNPSYVIAGSDADTAYAVWETYQSASGAVCNAVASYRWNAEGMLVETGWQACGGVPCHLAVSPSGRSLVVAEYGEGSVAVFGLSNDGAVGELIQRVYHVGPPSPAESHPHMACFDPATGHVLVPDLGLDRIYVYEQAADETLVERVADRLTLPTGSGPRQIAVHPRSIHRYVANEFDSTITILTHRDGRLESAGRVSSLPPDADCVNSPAAIRVTSSGSHVLVSNRGHNSVSLFARHQHDGTLRMVTNQLTRGATPPDLVITDDDRFVLVADQDSGDIAVFELDPDSDRLAFLETCAVASPSSVALLRP